MTANWHLEESRAEFIIGEYFDIWKSVGAARFGRAVHSLLYDSGLKFFPSIAEFRGYIPASEKRAHCGNCQDGFVMRPDYEARRLYKNDSAMKAFPCECTGGADRLKRLQDANPTWEAPQ